MITLPFLLTAFRFISSLFILPFLFIHFLPFNLLTYNIYLAVIFVAVGLTDFFDGYFARKFNQTTVLGSLFDPLSDKIFMMATFISLVAAGKLWFYWAIIFIAREFLVMGVRELALHEGFVLKVGYGGKVKTAVQMVLCTYIIVSPYQLSVDTFWWNGMETLLLAMSLFLSIGSALLYGNIFWQKIKN